MTAADELRRRLVNTLAEAMGEAVSSLGAIDPSRVVELCEQAVRDARDWRHALTTTTEETPDER